MQRIIDGLAEDEVALKYETVMEMAAKVNLDSYATELTTLHNSRKIKDLYMEPVLNPADLQKAILVDASFRSRCVAIINDLAYQQRLINTTVDALNNHILSKYNAILTENYSTVASRASAVKNLLKTGYEKLEELNTIVSMAQEIIKDIDQAGWQTRNLVSLIDIMTNRENLVNVLD